MSTEVWYILEDGSMGDPHEVVHKNGRLQHKDGRAVAYASHGPRTKSVDADAERTKSAKAKPASEVKDEAQEARQSPAHHRRDMTAEGSGRPYKTR